MTSDITEFLRSPFIIDPSVDESGYVAYPTSAAIEGSSLLVFGIKEWLFGLSSLSVSAITELSTIEKVPFIKNRLSLGFISHKGSAVPVVDLAQYLGLGAIERPTTSKQIVIEHEKKLTGFMAQHVLGVHRCKLSEDPRSNERGFISGKVISMDRLITVLDPAQITDALMEGCR